MLRALFRGWTLVSGCDKKGFEKSTFFSSLSFQVQGSVYTVQYDVYENEEERIGDEIEEVEVIEGENGDDSNRSQKL